MKKNQSLVVFNLAHYSQRVYDVWWVAPYLFEFNFSNLGFKALETNLYTICSSSDPPIWEFLTKCRGHLLYYLGQQALQRITYSKDDGTICSPSLTGRGWSPKVSLNFHTDIDHDPKLDLKQRGTGRKRRQGNRFANYNLTSELKNQTFFGKITTVNSFSI